MSLLRSAILWTSCGPISRQPPEDGLSRLLKTGPGTTGATQSMRPRSVANWAGSRPKSSKPDCARRYSGILKTPRGLIACARAPTAIGSRKTIRSEALYERNHSCGWFWDPALSSYTCCFETAAAGLQQADGLLPAEHAYARRASRDPAHLDAAGHGPLQRFARRRSPVGNRYSIRRATKSRWTGPGISNRPRLHRRFAVCTHPRR